MHSIARHHPHRKLFGDREILAGASPSLLHLATESALDSGGRAGGLEVEQVNGCENALSLSHTPALPQQLHTCDVAFLAAGDFDPFQAHSYYQPRCHVDFRSVESQLEVAEGCSVRMDPSWRSWFAYRFR